MRSRSRCASSAPSSSPPRSWSPPGSSRRRMRSTATRTEVKPSSTKSGSRCSAISSTAWTSPSFPTSRVPRTNPASRTGPEDVPAGADNTHLTGEVDFAIRITIALALGLVLGAEREFRGHPAGLRTMALIGAGSCMFTAVGLIPEFGSRVDPTCVAAQIVTGVGFLGAGSILRQGEEVRGLTTAASIWVTASIGMAVGFGYYGVAIFTTVIVVVVLVALKPLEEKLFRSRRNRRAGDPHPDE